MLLRESIIENWSTAICNLAVKENKQKKFIEETNIIVEVLKDQEMFKKILNAHLEAIPTKINKDKIIDEVFLEMGIDEYLVNTMKILARKNSFEYARPIFKAVRKDLLLDFDQEYGVIWSTMKLKKNDIEKIETKLSKKLDLKVKLVNKIDPDLIGGIQVVVANNIYDLSVKGQLDKLKLQTLETKINK